MGPRGSKWAIFLYLSVVGGVFGPHPLARPNTPISSISQWWEGYLGPQGPRAPPPGQIPLFPLSLSGGRGIWAPRPGGAKYPYFLYLSVVGGVKMTPWGSIRGGAQKGHFDPFLGPLFGTPFWDPFGKVFWQKWPFGPCHLKGFWDFIIKIGL